jgi:hypothetical protein
MWCYELDLSPSEYGLVTYSYAHDNEPSVSKVWLEVLEQPLIWWSLDRVPTPLRYAVRAQITIRVL